VVAGHLTAVVIFLCPGLSYLYPDCTISAITLDILCPNTNSKIKLCFLFANSKQNLSRILLPVILKKSFSYYKPRVYTVDSSDNSADSKRNYDSDLETPENKRIETVAISRNNTSKILLSS
jgi:hypothetical protein